MYLEEKAVKFERMGQVTGYVCSYLLFTGVMFFVIFYLGKLPESWSFLHIALITILVSSLGFIVKRWLSLK